MRPIDILITLFVLMQQSELLLNKLIEAMIDI